MSIFFFPANPSWTEVWDTDFFRNFVGFFPCFFHWGFKKKSLICKIIDFPHIIQTYDLFKFFHKEYILIKHAIFEASKYVLLKHFLVTFSAQCLHGIYSKSNV